MALPEQARVLVRGARRCPGARLSPPRQLVRDRRPRGLQARFGGQQRGANAVREWARAERLSAYDSRRATGILRNLIVREGRRTGQIQTRLVTSPGEIPRPPVDLHTVIEGRGGGTLGPTGVLGAEHLSEELCGLRFRVSHDAFLQTNTEMAERLYGIVAESGGLRGGERVFDLFCGIGTIALSIARGAGEVWGLESVPDAVADAEENAAANAIDNAHLRLRRRAARRPAADRGGGPARRHRRRPAARRALEEDRPQGARVRRPTDRLRLLQPHDPGAERGSDGRGRLYPAAGAAGRHVPADPARRVRRGARAMSGQSAAGARRRGFGVAAGLDPAVAGRLAARCAELGYSSLWSNDHPGALGLETLAAFAEAAPELELGVAVMALDRHSPDEIAPTSTASASTAIDSGSASEPASRSGP